ncbi:MAG: TIGR03435 family protein [Candidatus Acidiferrales bacterium]
MTGSSITLSRINRKFLWTAIRVTAVPRSLPLIFIAALVLVGVSYVPNTLAQSEPGRLPSFEVASIKLNKSATPLTGGHLFEGRYNATSPTIGAIESAYGQNGMPLSPSEVSGGPDWIKSEVYDIEAKVDDSLVQGEWKKLSFDEKFDQVRLMMRSLLVDRYKLKVRHETKELPVYALVLDKNGPKFAEDNSHPETAVIKALGRGKLEAKCLELTPFVFILSRQPELGGRIVLDRTGLKGHYSFKFQWTPENLSAMAGQSGESASAPDSSGTSLFAALREQLGLRLVARKAPVDTIVIEHIERPSGN